MTRERLVCAILFVCAISIPLLAQPRSGTLTVHYYALASPFIALVAGILILIIPRILNYVVAFYLILIGLIGLFGR